MRNKYLVLGGYVISKNDGQKHYINCYRLMELYGVKKEYCDFAEEGMHTIFANKHDDYERS
jgi:hypothetical protein